MSARAAHDTRGRPASRHHGGEAHLLIYLHQLHGEGGADQVITRIGRGIVARGVPVDLLVGTVIGCDGGRLGHLVGGMKLSRLDNGIGRSKGILAQTFALARYLARHRPATVLTTKDTGNAVTCLAAMLSGTPARVVLRQAHHMSTAIRDRGVLRDLGFRLLARWALRRADGIIVVAEDLVSDMRALTNLPQERFSTIRNPADLPEIRRLAGETPPLLERTGGGAPLLVAAGRLKGQKDFATLLRAFRVVRNEFPARLIILGEGDERGRLEALRRDLGLINDVELPGFCENPFPVIARADLVVVSSRFEGSPNVLVEALALGVNVVATDCPTGPREVLDNGRYGRLAPVGDEGALARAILSALASPLPRDRLRARAEAYALEPNIDEYISVLFAEESQHGTVGDV